MADCRQVDIDRRLEEDGSVAAGLAVGEMTDFADIRDEVVSRYHSEAMVEDARVVPLNVPGIQPMLANRVEALFVVVTMCGIAEELIESLEAPVERPLGDREVVMGPGSSPRRPAPNRVVPGEEIRVLDRSQSARVVGTGHVHDPFVVAKQGQHGLAELEECRHWYTVVLEDDRFLTLAEDPVHAR